MSRNGKRQGFIVACASHQKKKIAMAAQLNSILVQSYPISIVFVFV